MGKSRLRKGLKLALLGFVAVVTLGLVTHPWWLPLALRPVLRRYGVTYAAYHSSGFHEFSLTGVEVRSSEVNGNAREIRVLLPVTYWKNAAAHATNLTYVTIRDANLQLVSQKTSKPYSGLAAISASTQKYSLEAARWVPVADISNLRLTSDGKNLWIDQAHWAAGSITGTVRYSNFPPAAVEASLANPLHARFTVTNWQSIVDLSITRHSDTADVSLRFRHGTNDLTATAQFSSAERIPNEARVDAIDFSIPSELHQLDGYRPIAISLHADWSHQQGNISLTAAADPLEDGLLTPLRAQLDASVSTNDIRFRKAILESSWANASLTDGGVIAWNSQMTTIPLELKVHADFSRQHLIPLEGSLSGSAILQNDGSQFPHAVIHLSGDNIKGFGFTSEKVGAKLDLDWPSLIISSGTLNLPGGTAITVVGKANLASSLVDQLLITLNGPIDLPAQKLHSRQTEATVEISGRLKQLTHKGRITAHGFQYGDLPETSIAADWHGKGESIDEFISALEVRQYRVLADGAASLGKTNELSLSRFEGSMQGTNLWTLQKPASIFWNSKSTNGPALFRIDPPLLLTGPGFDLSASATLTGIDNGKIDFSERGFDTAWLNGWLAKPAPAIVADRLTLTAAWTPSALNYQIEGAAHGMTNGMPISVNIAASGDREKVTVQKFALQFQTNLVATLTGDLPLRIQPTATNFSVAINKTANIQAELATVPAAEFWKQISAMTGFDIDDPQLKIHVSGTLSDPRGDLTLSAAGLGNEVISLKPITLHAIVTPDQIAIDDGQFSIEKQAIRVTATIPFHPKSPQWTHWFAWKNATGSLKIQEAKLAELSRLAPAYISPQGRLSCDFAVGPGMNLQGSLNIREAATRPFGTFGVVQDISADLEVTNRNISIESLKATAGGGPVTAHGSVRWTGTDFKKEIPEIRLVLSGREIGLVRKPEAIVRSDFDLNVTNAPGTIAMVTGSVNLKDSFFLTDVRALLPGRVSKPSERPPFFSVDLAPFSSWRMNVNVRGDHFMRVRSPLFVGSVSAALRIEGTLGDPLASGEVTVNDGTLLFPFATLSVQQGIVSLTADNPFQPSLFLTAGSKVFGYDVHMQVSGPASKPVIEFTSNPGLSSEQVLLMVTAGQLPRDEINYSTTERAQKLAFFFGKSLLSKFTGNPGQEDRLTVHSGENVTQNGKETYSIEYKLSEDWSLIGEYDQFNALNAGLKWRFFSK